MDLAELQAAIARTGLDGWLIADFRGGNPAFADLSGITAMTTRRVFCYVPAVGTPTVVGSQVDGYTVRSAAFPVRLYLTYQEREAILAELLAGARRVAMEYSTAGRNPYVARVDAGTVELVRSLGLEVVSSADLLDLAIARWDDGQVAAHREAAAVVDRVRAEAFDFAFGVLHGKALSEWDVAAFILDRFKAEGLRTEDSPVVAIGQNAADPHYFPQPDRCVPLRPDELLLIDLWAQGPGERDPFADSTWVAYLGTEPSAEVVDVFAAVAAGRDLAVSTIATAWKEGRRLAGWEVDHAVRDLIAGRGYGEFFTHRTGHSLGWRYVHGDGAHLDDFETRDERVLGVGSAVTIEPGVYLPGRFGVRLEIDLVIAPSGPVVTTGVQRGVLTPLSE